MARDAIRYDNEGREAVPVTPADWTDWVAPTHTRNFVLGDPLLDWLNLYGEENGFVRDTDLPGYDVRTDFTEFIFEQGRRFEAGVVDLLRQSSDVVTVSSDPEHIRDLAMAERTFDVMEEGDLSRVSWKKEWRNLPS